MRAPRFSQKHIPILFIPLILLTYGLLITKAGFHWDDWVFAFLAHFYGPADLVLAFARNRPFLGPIFFITTNLMGDSPLRWQLFGLLIRFLMTYAFWWALSTLWPKHKKQVLTTALLFLVFPGYSQQWVALTHINQELIPLIAYLFSFGATVYAVTKSRKPARATLISLALMFIGLFATEYFFGFEAIRLMILFYVSRDGTIPQRVQRTFRRWLPYLALWLGNLSWLVYFRVSGRYASYGIQIFDTFDQGVIKTAITMFTDAIRTIKISGFDAWTQTFELFRLPMQESTFWFALGLLAVGFALVAFFLLRFEENEAAGDSDPWAVQAVLLGIVGILAGRVPSLIAGLPVAVRYDFDRFQMSMMFGACLLLAGLLEMFLKAGKRKILIVSLLVALGVSYQFQNATNFQRDWENQKQFFSEIAWRMPGIEPGTILLSNQINPIPFESDMALTAPLNWIYAPELSERELPYVFLFTKIRLGRAKLPSLNLDEQVAFDYRTAWFSGSTSDSIVFYYPEVGCLKVLDPINPDESSLAGLPQELEEAVKLSNLSRINPDSAPPVLPEVIFGKPAAPGWCYYYQKAELARQSRGWTTIAELGEETLEQGLSPQNPLEWLPFVEAYAYTGDMEQAAQMTVMLTREYPDSRPAVCQTLARIAQSQDPAAAEFASRELEIHACH